MNLQLREFDGSIARQKDDKTWTDGIKQDKGDPSSKTMSCMSAIFTVSCVWCSPRFRGYERQRQIHGDEGGVVRVAKVFRQRHSDERHGGGKVSRQKSLQDLLH